MYGKTPLDALRIDEVVSLWGDQLKNIASYRFAKSDADKVFVCARARERVCVCVCVCVGKGYSFV